MARIDTPSVCPPVSADGRGPSAPFRLSYQKSGLVLAAVLSSFPLSACRRQITPPPARRLTVLATNDFHGAFREQRVSEDEAWGGAASLAAVIEEQRAATEGAVLLVDGGDLFQGSPLVNRSAGLAAIELFDMLGYDAAAIGNHEFDYGLEALQAAGRAASFPLLGANISADGAPLSVSVSAQRAKGTRAGEQGSSPADLGRAFGTAGPAAPSDRPGSVLIERGGIRVGLIGLTTADTPTTTHPDNVRGIRFAPVEEVARREATALRAAGAEVIIALAHVNGACQEEQPEDYLQFEPGCALPPDSELGRLAALEGVLDAIVAGHTNQLIADDLGVPILQSRTRGWALGRLELTVQGDQVEVTPAPPIAVRHPPREPACGEEAPHRWPEGSLAARVTAWLDAAERDWELEPCRVEGCVSADLSTARDRQSPAGNLVTQAISRRLPEVEVALHNAGGIRTALPAGPITFDGLYRMLPFPNTVVSAELSGRELLDLIARGSSGAHGQLQLSGAELVLSEERAVCALLVGGAPITAEQRVQVALNDFLAAGGDGLPELGARAHDTGLSLRAAVRQLLAEAGSACVDPLSPAPEQVIRVEPGCTPLELP